MGLPADSKGETGMKPIRLRPAMTAGIALLALASATTGAAAQQVITLTPTSNLSVVLAGLRPGDTLRITGSFAAPLALRNRDFGNVQVDASAATFQGGLVLSNVHVIVRFRSTACNHTPVLRGCMIMQSTTCPATFEVNRRGQSSACVLRFFRAH